VENSTVQGSSAPNAEEKINQRLVFKPARREPDVSVIGQMRDGIHQWSERGWEEAEITRGEHAGDEWAYMCTLRSGDLYAAAVDR